jgi:hypothetical protein
MEIKKGLIIHKKKRLFPEAIFLDGKGVNTGRLRRNS